MELLPDEAVRIGRPETSSLRNNAIVTIVVARYERLLLADAKNQGYGYHNGRELSDLELLASLQHYGAATRLLDFSQSAYVALWFACREDPEETGIVFGMDTSTIRLIREPNLARADMSTILTSESRYKPNIVRWEPPPLYRRISAQRSVFVISTCTNYGWGSIEIPDAFSSDAYQGEDLFAIAISPRMKQEMSTQWGLVFGFSTDSMFPDIAGFGQHHGPGSSFEWNFFNR